MKVECPICGEIFNGNNSKVEYDPDINLIHANKFHLISNPEDAGEDGIFYIHDIFKYLNRKELKVLERDITSILMGDGSFAGVNAKVTGCFAYPYNQSRYDVMDYWYGLGLNTLKMVDYNGSGNFCLWGHKAKIKGNIDYISNVNILLNMSSVLMLDDYKLHKYTMNKLKARKYVRNIEVLNSTNGYTLNFKPGSTLDFVSITLNKEDWKKINQELTSIFIKE